MRYATRSLLLLLLGVAVVAIVYFLVRRDPTPILPPDVAHRQDSLVATKPHADSVIQAGRDSAALHQHRSQAAAGRAQGQVAASARERALADSLTRVAADAKDAADSATHYRLALEARTAERDRLLAAHAEDSTALVEAHAANGRLRASLDTAEDRRAALERQNRDLAKAIKQAEKGCRVAFGLISCPTRTEAFLAGVAGGAILDAVIQHNTGKN